MNSQQVKELILQSLEHERGGVLIYRAALTCVSNDDLRRSWEHYLTETENHVTTLETICSALELDPEEMTPGRKIVAKTGEALVEAITMAEAGDNAAAAEIVAAECVVLAETKDHADWHLLGQCAEHLSGRAGTLLKAAYDRIEDEEDEHLYHSKGWLRELQLKALGLHAVLPPPEEVKNVKSAVAAAKAEHDSERSRPH